MGDTSECHPRTSKEFSITTTLAKNMTQPTQEKAAEVNLTEKELAILNASRETDYGDASQGESPWVFAVIEKSRLDSKVARGVIASLVRKELAAVGDYEGKGKPDDMVFSLTTKGIEVLSETEIQCTA